MAVRVIEATSRGPGIDQGVVATVSLGATSAGVGRATSRLSSASYRVRPTPIRKVSECEFLPVGLAEKRPLSLS
jgi:hypothetical protein